MLSFSLHLLINLHNAYDWHSQSRLVIEPTLTTISEKFVVVLMLRTESDSSRPDSIDTT